MKQRKYTHDYFNVWRDARGEPYIWLQVNYLTDSLLPFHFISEINDERNNHIAWPISDYIELPLPCSSLDFRDGKRYDFSDWHERLSKYSGVNITPQSDIVGTISTYEDYIRKANLRGCSCLDIDVIEMSNVLVGIEGTHLIKSMFNREEALRLFGFILDKRFFLEGAHQLIVQYNTLKLLQVDFYLLIYNIRGNRLCEDCNSLLVNVDAEFIDAVRRRDKNKCFQKAYFGPFRENYQKMVADS